MLCILSGILIASGFGQAVSGISISPAIISGGASAKGTVTLTKAAPTGGFTVTLGTSQPFLAAPATVSVSAGSKTVHFEVSTDAISKTQTAKMTASGGGTTKSVTVTVTAAPLYLVTVFPQAVAGGSVTIGTVSLDGIAPPSGTAVQLLTNSPLASVPSSVTVPSGYSFTTFLVSTSATTSSARVVITAKLGRTLKYAGLLITPSGLGDFTIYPGSVAGGGTAVGTVSLTGSAPAGGYKIGINSSKPSVASVPSSVTVPAGANFATFNITTSAVNPSTSVIISVSANGIGLSQPLKVLYINLGFLSVSPTSVVGGSTSTGTVSLGGTAPAQGYTVALSSNLPGVTVPASVWIAGGGTSASFVVSTSPVPVNTVTTITAAAAGGYTTANLSINAASVSGLTFNQSQVIGGGSVTGTLGLSNPAPAGFSVQLSSSDPSVWVPTSVTFTAGSTTANFTAISVPVAVNTPVSIYATSNNQTTSASLTVDAPGLSLVTFNPNSVIAGVSSYGTVSLTGPAPAGFVVQLTSNSPALIVPSSITFTQGATFATFLAQTGPIAINQTDMVTATVNGGTASGALNIVTGLSNGQGLDLTSPWARFHGDAQNSGQTENGLASTDWSSAVGSKIESSPAVGLDGTLYFGADNGIIYAVNPLTGGILWQVKTGARVVASPVLSGKGALFVGSADSCMYAIRITDGTILWKVKTGAPITSSAAVGADGNIYFGSWDHYVYALSQNSGALVWTVKTYGPVESSPNLSVDGTLYIGSDDFNMYAIDTVKATVKWSFATDGYVASSPALANGLAYFGSDGGDLYAVNALNGQLVWFLPTGWSVYSSPAVDQAGNVYVGSEDGKLYAVNGANGSLLWSYTTGDAIESSPAVDRSGNVYVGSCDGNLYELSTATGQVEYKFTEGFEFLSSPIIAGTSTVVVGTADGKLIHKNLSQVAVSGWGKFHGNAQNTGQSAGSGATGIQQWAASNVGGTSSPTIGADGTVYSTYLNNLYSVNYHTGATNWIYQATAAWTNSSPAVGTDGTLYIGSSDGGLYAISGRTGTLNWKFATGSAIVSSPVVAADGTVYVGSNDGNFYAVNGIDGTQKWKAVTGGPVQSSPALYGGMVYVGSDDNKVYAFNSQTGSTVFTFPTGNKVKGSPAMGPDGTLYVGSTDTNLYAVNSVTGALIWTYGTGNQIVSCPAVSTDGTVYVSSTDGFLYSINGKTGVQNWYYNTGTAITASPVLGADGTVYFGFAYSFAQANNFFALSSAGKFLWSLNVPGASMSPAIAADGTIYVGSVLTAGGSTVGSLLAIH